MSFFFNLSASVKTSSPIFKESLNFILNLVSFTMSELNLLLVSCFTLCNLWQLHFFLNSWSFILFGSMFSGAKPYFTNLILFKLFIAFWLSLIGLILFLVICLSKTFVSNSSFLNSLSFCSAAKALPSLILLWSNSRSV